MADVVKYGIQIPNRVFVGGVAFDTKEDDLKEFFSQYGKIKECKIIKDSQSISKGFAFITFECKHDAVQTQQLGTVFFNQKKLNLGPAIRQKGVVFNGCKEVENEPVLSTGVYIHPSGYSYTVAPNGVWYFHNADGKPPTQMPGSAPMTYAANLIKRNNSSTHEQPLIIQRPSSTGGSSTTTCESISPPTVMENSSVGLPIFRGGPPEMPHMQTTQILQTQSPYQSAGYSTMGTPNIHVAFQNMSISSHPGVPIGHHQVHMAPPTVTSHNPHVMNNGITPTGPVHYTRMTEMYVPYYANAKPPSPCINGNHVSSQQTAPTNRHAYSIPVQRPEYYTMMPSTSVKDGYIYPICEPYYQSAYICPQTDQHGFPVHEVSCNGFYKRITTKPPAKMHRSQGKYAQHMKSECALEDPAILESSCVTLSTK